MKKTILLNGAIRDTEEFQLIIDCILHKIDKYASDVEVIVSTWHEDIAVNKPLISWIMKKGIRVVGSASLDVGGPANVFRQWRTMEAGLSHISNGNIVLKGRTDKFLLRKDAIDAFLRTPIDAPEFVELAESQKLAVEHVTISLPFMAKDMVYLGSVAGIRRIMHYSVRTQYVADHIFNGIGPECFLWLESCAHSQDVMTMIQKVEFKEISNLLMSEGSVDKFDWSRLPPHVVALFRQWFNVFDENFLFLSDVIPCTPSPSWPIDEGSWRYQTGDRKEYEMIKGLVDVLPEVASPSLEEAPFLNSAKEYSYELEETVEPTFPFPADIDDIRSNDERKFSDIVLLRQALIDRELAKEQPDQAALASALRWNIRQRDRHTLQTVYDWLMSDAKECAYLSEADKVFVIERMVDLFTFKADQNAIERTIASVPSYFKGSGLLRTRMAEHYFTKRKLYRALYWFFLSHRSTPDSLGVNHGLGCTLLDLSYPRLALRYLRKAHAVMPADQTAAFTLIRGLHACRKYVEAKVMMQQLTGALRVEAERILNV